MGYNNTPNVIVQIDNKAIREQQEKADRQTQVINQGTSLITADQTTPLDIQVEGRTLVPLQNTNLSEGPHVLANADKKIRIIVDNKSVSGVAKFTKQSTLSRRASFSGKIQGSTGENPHSAFTILGATLGTPQSTVGKFDWNTSQISYDQIKTLDGTSKGISSSTNGFIAQTLFSFDLIAEVERNMGRIPGADTAAKVQWLKDNLQNADVKWHGFGSGPAGNKATLSVWLNTGSWLGFGNTTSGTVALLQGYTNSAGAISARIQPDGFMHFLAYSEPTDGVTPAVVATDFIELLIDLKPTAQIDSRPQIVRHANYEGKVTGDVTVNPNIAKSNATRSDTTLLTPSAWQFAEFGGGYASISAMGGAVTSVSSAVTTGSLMQKLFSFDIVTEVEKNLGRIPAANLPGKVQWLKDNLSRIVFNWWGYGNSPSAGYKATLSHWRASGGGSWDFDKVSHTSSTIARLQIVETNEADLNWAIHIRNNIDDGGFVHFLVNSEAANGTTASALTTDFAELEIRLAPGAVLHDPQVPLYQVDSTEYTKILGEWSEAEVLTRYPKITGIQHVQNPYVMAEGENMLPPFYEWNIGANATNNFTINDPYSVTLLPTLDYQTISANVPVIPGSQLTLDFEKSWPDNINFYADVHSRDPITGTLTPLSMGIYSARTFTIPAGTTLITVGFKNYLGIRTEGTITRPILTMGAVKKPFVPKDPSYLFTQMKLGQISLTKDILFKQDGWKVRKFIEKDYILDGSFEVAALSVDQVGFKVACFPIPPGLASESKIVIRHDGEVLKNTAAVNGPSNTSMSVANGYLYISVPDSLSGMGEAYALPTVDEWKAHFNGWQAKTVDANGKPTSWRSLGDGTDAPTQTLAYVKANKAPNFTPYKISYVLASPVTEDVSDKIEGDITVNGITQTEVGSGVIVREKVTPWLSSGVYHINASGLPVTLLKNKAAKIIAVYKNGVYDSKARIVYSGIAGGLQRAEISQADYDTTAEYKVTYLVLDRDRFTVNPYNVKTTYAKNIRTALEDVVKKQEDNTRDISVNVQAVAELYRRMKSMGG